MGTGLQKYLIDSATIDDVDFLIVTSFKRLCIFEFKFIYFIITSG